MNNNEDDSLKAKPAVYNETRVIIGSAARINLSQHDAVEQLLRIRSSNKWQEDAWEYYDLVGEIKQAATLLANITSRIRLYPAYITDDNAIPSILNNIDDVPDNVKENARNAMTLLTTGNGGTAGLLRDAALNLFITGECYLVREPSNPKTGESEKWQIRSVSEFIKSNVKSTKNGVKVESALLSIKPRKNSSEEDYVILPDNVFFGRIWRNHPRYSLDPDSSLLGVLELLEELLLIDKSSRTLLRSRLSAGLLLIPDELDNISQSDGETDSDDDEFANLADDASDSIEEELMDVLMEPIKNEGSAAAAIPTFFRGKAEYLDKIKHITFERPNDDTTIQRNEKVLQRIMTSLDLPTDVMAGFANIKYSNAIVVEDSLYRSHVEPLILMIVDCLTTVFLRPILRGLQVPEEIVSRVTIWYDPSSITTKPDKASAAGIGYAQQTISAQAWRRENGFSETDAPTQLELAQRMAVSKGLLSEPITEALLRTLIPEVLNSVKQQVLENMDPSSAAALQQAVGPTEVNAEPVPGAAPALITDTISNQESGTKPPTELINP